MCTAVPLCAHPASDLTHTRERSSRREEGRHVSKRRTFCSELSPCHPCRQKGGGNGVFCKQAELDLGLAWPANKIRVIWMFKNATKISLSPIRSYHPAAFSRLLVMTYARRPIKSHLARKNLPRSPDSSSSVVPTWLGSQVQQMSFLLVGRRSGVDFKKWKSLHQPDFFKNVIPIWEDLGMRNSGCASQT